MYCSSSVIQPVAFSIDEFENKTIVVQKIEESMGKLFEAIKGTYCPIVNGISTVVNGYTEGKEKRKEILEQVYLMTQNSISQAVRPFTNAYKQIEDIAKLQADWNENGAEKFSDALIEKAKKILSNLVAEPFICPTACGAIQFEYEKENGAYLEFEIYEDRIKMFSITENGEEYEEVFCGVNATNKIKQMVVDFYA